MDQIILIQQSALESRQERGNFTSFTVRESDDRGSDIDILEAVILGDANATDRRNWNSYLFAVTQAHFV